MESAFAVLDTVQAKVYENAARLLDPAVLLDPVSRAKLLRTISRLLVSFSDYLALEEVRDPSDPRIALYKGKHRALLARVRQVQLCGLTLRVNAEMLAKQAKYEQRAADTPQLHMAPVNAVVPKTEPENNQVLAQNKRITALLQATRAMLHSSVLQSELNIDSLAQQTLDLHKLHDDYGQFNDLLVKSKQIVKFIEKQDRSDKRRIYISGLFFASCCAWVIWKRILRRPVLILVWSLLKTMRMFSWITKPGSVTTTASLLSISSTLTTLILSTQVSLISPANVHSSLDAIVDVLSSTESVLSVSSVLAPIQSSVDLTSLSSTVALSTSTPASPQENALDESTESSTISPTDIMVSSPVTLSSSISEPSLSIPVTLSSSISEPSLSRPVTLSSSISSQEPPSTLEIPSSMSSVEEPLSSLEITSPLTSLEQIPSSSLTAESLNSVTSTPLNSPLIAISTDGPAEDIDLLAVSTEKSSSIQHDQPKHQSDQSLDLSSYPPVSASVDAPLQKRPSDSLDAASPLPPMHDEL